MADPTRPLAARWVAHHARIAAERAARRAVLTAADWARFDRLLVDEARWIFATTMAANPHSYCLRREFAHDADFVWLVTLIRTCGDREKFPPVGGRFYDVLIRHDRKYWAMGHLGGGGPINFRDGRPCVFVINRKPAFCPGDRR